VLEGGEKQRAHTADGGEDEGMQIEKKRKREKKENQKKK